MYYGNPTCNNQQNISGTWNSDYVLVQHLSETTGNYLDSTTYDNNGIFVDADHDSIRGAPGKIAGSLSLNGDADYIHVLDNDSLSFGNGINDSPFTVEVWVNTVSQYSCPVLTKGFWSLYPEYVLMLSGSDHVIRLYAVSTNHGYAGRIRNLPLPTGTWHHIVGTYNGNKTCVGFKIFLNGTQVDNHNIEDGTYTAMSNQNGELFIGREVSLYAQEILDEIRILKGVRTAEWILTEYRNQNDPSTFMTIEPEQSRISIAKYGSPIQMQNDSQWQWSNFTWVNSTLPLGKTIGWRIYYCDGSGNINHTDIMSFLYVNHFPYTPKNPSPINGWRNVSVYKDLSWTGGDPDPLDTVTYDIYLGTSNPPPKVANNRSATTYDTGMLNLHTTYYWKIISWDNHHKSTNGPIWSFTTE